MVSTNKTDVDYQKDWDSNPFRKPYLEKIVVNCCVGEAGEELKKAQRVLELMTNKKPALSKAKKSVKEWGIRKGLNISTLVTLRGDEAKAFLKRVMFVTDNRILRKSFDNYGNFALGIDEHIKVPDVKYLPELGIIGFNVTGRIVRSGHRVKVRRKQRSKIAKDHYVSKTESMYFLQKEFGIQSVDKMEEIFY